MMLRFDPFKEVDRMHEQVFGRSGRLLPLDLYRSGEHSVLHVDMPGVDPGSIDVSVDGSALTIRAERTGRTEEALEWLARERPVGTYLRQLALGDGLDTERIAATYENGVLTVTIPVAEKAKPRRIAVERRDGGAQAVGAAAEPPLAVTAEAGPQG